MDLSLNFATDDAVPARRKAKPASGARAKAGRKPQKQQQASRAAKVDNTAARASEVTHNSPARNASSSGTQKAASSSSKHASARSEPGHRGTSSSASQPQQDTASTSQTSGKPQIISSLFPRLPRGSRPAEVATEVEEEVPAKVLDASNAPSMADSFESLPLRSSIVAHLKGKMGLTHPTTIQKLAVPFLCNSETRRKDAILQAQTGSGKTLSYLLPIVEDLVRISNSISPHGRPVDRSIGTMAIILVPTRELANQIFEVAVRLLSFASEGGANNHRWITPGLLTGGAHRQHEKARLRKGIPLLIATPGRLLDHLETTKAFRLAGEAVRKPKDPASAKLTGEALDSDDEFAIEDDPTAATVTKDAADEVSSDEDFEGKGRSRSYRGNAPLASGVETALNPHLNLRWLVLDEADRLMDMGFEPQVTSIMNLLSARLDKRKAALARALNRGDVRSRLSGQKRKYIELDQRRTLLCSATIQENVEKLAGVALKDPLLIKGDSEAKAAIEVGNKPTDGSSWSHYAPPSQLSQLYAVVEPKLRFVTLVALLRQLLLSPTLKTASAPKILVFLSCTDSVDLHWHAMANLQMGRNENAVKKTKSKTAGSDAVRAQSEILPEASVYRLHGSLDLKTRLASLKDFANITKGAAVLFCTSVAARGLDVPDVNCVIQYDLPTEGGVTEYVHRVGRTARAGASGQSWAFLLPPEAAWVDWAEKEMAQASEGVNEKRLQLRTIQTILKAGYGGKDSRDYENRATDVQMAYERWVADDASNLNLARKAFSSHVRAYATHPSNEKEIFHVKNLHLGHLAKAFGLREAPSGIGGVPKQKKMAAGARLPASNAKRKRNDAGDSEGSEDDDVAPKRPTIPRSGRALEGKGLHGPKSVTRSDFNVANTSALEALVARKGIRR